MPGPPPCCHDSYIRPERIEHDYFLDAPSSDARRIGDKLMDLIGIDGARLGFWVLAVSKNETGPTRFELAKDLRTMFYYGSATPEFLVGPGRLLSP